MVNSLHVNAGDTGLNPGAGRSHMPWGNEAHVPQLLSLCSRAVVHSKRSHLNEKPVHYN